MEVISLSNQERIRTGCSHVAIVDYSDLSGTAATSKTLQVFPYVARDIVDKAFFDLITPFDGTSTTNLTVAFGWNGTADDADGLIEAVELHNDATEVLAGDATGAAFATKRTGFAAQDAGNLELVFTSTGANLTDLTTGKVRVYFNVIELSKLRGISGT